MVDARLPVPRVEVKDHLGVTGGPKLDPIALERSPQARIVVDLAIEDEDFAARSEHRLRATGEVDDRQPAVSKTDTAIFAHPRTGAVGPAVVNGLAHRIDECVVHPSAGVP